MSDERITLYVWKPNGHGPKSFFVMAKSTEEALNSVITYINEMDDDYSYPRDFPVGYEIETYSMGAVACNDND